MLVSVKSRIIVTILFFGMMGVGSIYAYLSYTFNNFSNTTAKQSLEMLSQSIFQTVTQSMMSGDPEQIKKTLCSSSAFHIERIRSNRVCDGEWYDQENDEWVMLLKGEATLEYRDGRLLRLQAGDHTFIPAHTPHRVSDTSEDAIWVAVHAKA